MKSAFFFLALFLVLPPGFSVAQTRPNSATTTTQSTAKTSPAVKPPATRPAATDAQSVNSSASPNRQQELYDQYHGITRKPPVVAPPPASRPAAETTPVVMSPSAPEAGTPSVRIGVRGGITYLIYTKDRTGVDPSVGFVGGLTFNLGAGKVSFQPEINYARYTTKGTVLGLGSLTVAADIIEVPLFLKISSGTYDGHRFFVNVGPYGAYAASASIDGKKQSLSGSTGRFGFGVAAGVGAALKAGPGHVTVEVRGSYILGNTSDGFTSNTNVIYTQATLGYSFPLGAR